MSTEQRIGPYELQQLLKKNTQLEIWKALDTRQRHYTAISILHVDAQVSPNAIKHFHEKIESLSHLHHPNIAQVLDIRTVQAADKTDRGILIASEYIEGQSLADYIQDTTRSGQIPPLNELVRLLAPICAAIDAAHQHNIIHGAIKPGNILLDKHNMLPNAPGLPKLAGFCTHYLQPSLTLPLNDTLYIAPEQAQGYMDNPGSDIYALGVILYEMCTGVLPFQGKAANDVLSQHIHNSPPSPALLNANLPPAFTSAIVRSLSKDPNARFPTASAMALALAAAVNIPAYEIQDQAGPWPGLEQSAQDAVLNSPAYASTPASKQNTPLPAAPVTNDDAASLHPPVTLLTPSITPVEPAPPALSSHSQPYMAMPRPAPVQAKPETGPYLASAPRLAATPPSRPDRKRPSRLYILLTGIILFVLCASAIGLYLLTRPSPTPTMANTIVGHAFFTNSGQYTPNSDQGIADIVQIHTDNLPEPAQGKSYYFWLLSDNDDVSVNNIPILLGSSANGGKIDIPFGDSKNRDLLSDYSRFLITEESSSAPPATPSLDKGTWRYYAAFSQAKDPQTNLSLLDHLRHLLSRDPKLQTVGLNGGLDVWLYRDMLNVMVLSSSVRDAQETAGADFLRRQIVRILDYLDGSQYINQEKLPPGTVPLRIDPTVAKVALLEFDARNQFPPGYLAHIGSHLASISQSPNVTPEQRALAIQIDRGLDNVQFWLNLVHKDAQQLVQMPDNQLLQPATRSLFNDLYIQANHAFTGQFDPNTNQVKEGVTQIHDDILRLATFDIQPYQAA